MRLFGSDTYDDACSMRSVSRKDEQIEHKMLTKAIETAQKKIESNNYGISKDASGIRSGYE